jgi:iron(III) transport system permease protein
MLDRNALQGTGIILLVSLVTLGPVVYLFVASFDVSAIGAGYKFGLDGWSEVIASSRTVRSIVSSFILSIRVPVAIVVAFGIAWLLIRLEVPGRYFIEMSLWFGFVLPSVPMMLGWILLLDPHFGLINLAAMKLWFVDGPIFNIYSAIGIIWVHLALTTVPVMVILLAPALRQLDSSFEEAADMSGANLRMTLRRVTIPLLMPAILTAFIAGLIRSLEAFEVEQILGAPAGIYVYSTRIFDLVNNEPPKFAQAMALSTLFVALLAVLATLYQLYLRKVGSRATITARGVRLQSRNKPWWVYLISGALIAYICFTIYVPLTVLVLGSFNKLFGFFFIDNAWTVNHWANVLRDGRFLRATGTSIVLGLSVAILGVLIFSLLAWVLVRSNVSGRSLLAIIIWLPLGIPGIVLGVALLSLMLEVPGLSKLYGTIVPLVLALIINAMPIGTQLLRGAIAQISAELEEAARMSGGTFLFIFRRITLPIMAPALVAVFLLTFTGTIREISTILLIAAPGTRTMSLLMFDFASIGRLESAAVVGVLIAIICLFMTALAARIGGRIGIRH